MNTAASIGGGSTVAPAIRFANVSKSFGGTLALDDVSFDVLPASVHALCGGNGSGKSTLIKILAGVHQADTGTIEVDGHSHDASRTNPGWSAAQGLHFVHQSIGTFASLTVAENFAIGSSFGARSLAPVPWRSLHRRVGVVLDRFELDVSPRTLMADVPPATRTMIAVARALQDDDSDVRSTLVLDEPTASLPPEEAGVLLDAMRGYARRGHAVIFVSHRLSELLTAADHATFLRDGRHIGTHPVSALSEERLVELITGHGTVPATARTTNRESQQVRLVLHDYSVGPLEGISLEVGSGEVVGLAGLLGSGRSTLLQSLFGTRPARAGRVAIDGEDLRVTTAGAAIAAGIAYVPEDRAGQAAFADLSTRANFTAPRLGIYWNRLWFRRSSERGDTCAAIERYQIKVADPEANFATMSGGNQQKVVLARWLECKPKVLLLDEPTQGVDIGARNAIHELIRGAAAAGAAVVVVSSDAQELVDLSDRVIGLHAGRISGEVSGADLTVHRCTEISHGFGSTTHQTGNRADVRTRAVRPREQEGIV
ncbi:sugar ABC transporter ATP-binding protein [soil metagenome]